MGEVGLVGPEREVEEKADRADHDPQRDKGPGDPRQTIDAEHLGGGGKRIERREPVGRFGGRGLLHEGCGVFGEALPTVGFSEFRAQD